MNDSYADAVKLRQQLVEGYRQLPLLEQKIVQLFSVIYEPVSRASFVLCWNHSEAGNQNGKYFTTSSLKPYLEKLLGLGLLVQQSGQGPQCHPLLVEIATRNAVQLGQFEMLAKVVQEKLPVSTRGKNGPPDFSNERQLLRQVRIGIYRQDIRFINQQLEAYYQHSYPKDKLSLDQIYQQVCNNPFAADWFASLPQELYESALSSILNHSLLNLTPADEAFALLEEDCTKQGKHSSFVQHILLTEQLIWRGKLHSARRVLESSGGSEHSTAEKWGWVNFLEGNNDKAIAHYSEALQILKKSSSKRKVYFQSLGGLFFVIALVKDGDPNRLSEALGYASLARQSKHWLGSIYSILEKLVQFQQGDLSQKEAVISAYPQAGHHSLETLLRALCLYWVDVDLAKARLPKVLQPLCQQAEAAGYHWLAMETAELLSRLKPRSLYGKQAAALRQNTGICSPVDSRKPQEAWELCLNALANLHPEEPHSTAKPEIHQRLAWFITYYSTNNYLIEPREQKINAQGVWSKGRPIALKRLKQAGELDYLTPQDLRVCAQLETEYSYGYYGQTQYKFGERAIAALIGHPFVFWADAPTTRVEIVKGEPELLVKKGKGERLNLQLSPEIKENKNVIIIKETPTQLKVIEIAAEHRRIAGILGKQNRLEVPSFAKERVLAAINTVSRLVTVHSDIGGGFASAEQVPAQTKPHIHLLPAGAGLKVAVLSRPFARGGPYYRPGTGGEVVIAEIDGQRLQTTRNLRQEKKLALAAIAACPTLSAQPQENGECLVEDPQECLELLLELQALGDTVVLEWPEGEKLRVSHQASLQDLQLKIERQNDWFATKGQLKLDDRLVLDMQQLLELLAQTPSRFIPLGDGQFLALTQEFRKRLDELRAFSEKQGKGLRVHPLAAFALSDWVEQVGEFKADRHWKEHIQRLKEIQNLEPELPSTLGAQLRDYQIDGFRWLARLSQWGVGACLADDMGVGKSLQALAVILTRAPAGSTLIVAPTSVCTNWVSEAQRFTPTLNPILFGSGDRQQVLNDLQPFDLLICSYGLLQQEEVVQMLTKVQWQTIVLDEGQFIKNFATKRSLAAMKLQGGFKLITTGTPIENHLGELWNLFRFINPGLLGSLESFKGRFAIPIERLGDRNARQQLQKLIQPFLLRRTKNEVLQELPSRTEIVLHVELSKEEMAFYEALRREAIAKLSQSDAAAGQKHLQVLAEIMRLRRACCNARLVLPNTSLKSSKLQLFGEVLAELLDNRHKALVFSQFVDHLSIIQGYLDAQKISYQYLDGSTPIIERKKRVDAFQSGVGDVFLISLKAGGTGLNLTAADYVIHMDPWWNPAVEDQASDRAHRIGQQRPVTIYRLVAKDTIEEKIVDLHHYKRELADSLLEGADLSGKISTEELLRLIHEG